MTLEWALVAVLAVAFCIALVCAKSYSDEAATAWKEYHERADAASKYAAQLKAAQADKVAVEARIFNAEDRAYKWEQKVGEMQRQIDHLGSLVDFSGTISPLEFKTRHRFTRPEEYFAADPVTYLRVYVEPLEYTMVLDAWDFSKVPAAIPAVANKIAVAMVRQIEGQIEHQLVRALKHEAERKAEKVGP